MATAKRDNKNRVLWSGERQRSDGKYEYRYIDSEGTRHSLYSWKLVQTDKTPSGKIDGPSLREQEANIAYDKHDGIDSYAAKQMTFDDFFVINMETRRLKESTRVNYEYIYHKFIHPVIGRRPIGSITYSDIKRFYYNLIEEKGFKPASMEVVHTIIHPIFTIAVRDGYIRTNPTEGVMGEIKRGRDWEKTKRKALTAEQQSNLLSYVKNHPTYRRWRLILVFMLGTGCRVGEAIGLRWEDVNFDEGIISINHNVIYRQRIKGACEFQITTPKTKAGIREIPLLDEVRSVLQEEYQRQLNFGYNKAVIDGYKHFVFCNRFNDMVSPHSINRALERITKDFNKMEEEKAQAEGRMPKFLPHITCHILRHTFCTRLCENTSDKNTLKMIQEIMGHCDISTTLDVYTDLTRDKKKEAFVELEGKIKL